MKQGIAYITSKSKGHETFPARATSQGSPNVLANGLGVHRETDTWDTHCNSQGQCHDGHTIATQSRVLINGLPAARILDPISCGDSIATGSQNVLVGD